MNHTKELLDFVIKQELPDVKYYPDLVPLISMHFSITKRHTDGEFVTECVNDIIDWENGKQFASLEETLSGKYIIEIRDSPKTPFSNKVIKDEKINP